MENTNNDRAAETVPDSSKLIIADQFLKALTTKDWDLLRSVITDDITWTLPGDSSVSGKVTGIDAVVKTATIIMNFGVALKLNHYMIALKGVALSLRGQANQNELKLDQPLAIACSISGGKIKAINTYVLNTAQINAFFTTQNRDLLEATVILGDKPEPVTNNESQKFALANTFITALKGNDWDAMRSIMFENLTWTLPGTSILSGMANGVNAVVKRAQSLKQFGVMFQLQHIIYGMNGFTLLLHNTAKRNELILDEYVAIVFDVKDGKIEAMTTYLSDVEGIERFFIHGIID